MIGKKNASKRTSSGEDHPRFEAGGRSNGGESWREHGIRIEETYVRVKGKWRYLYRALDSTGATIDFLLSTNRDAEAARRFWPKPWQEQTLPTPRLISTGKHAAYPLAVARAPSRRRSGGKPSAPAGAVPQ
jgi:transposase-like protein